MGSDTAAALTGVDSPNPGTSLVDLKPRCPSLVDNLNRIQQTPVLNKKSSS